ncbi:MAG: flippase-like domain-containing protein [Desulfobacteraceae bacterium]|nr:flippase-like domain-containing protein [Desulfobacteraceae bacterium]
MISTALLVLLFRGFDWSRFLSAMSGVPLSFYLYALCLNFFCQLLYVWKWSTVLRSLEVRAPFSYLVWAFFVGFFFANFLPTSAGQDVARVYYAGRRWGYLRIGSSVFMDRALSFFAMIFLAAILVTCLGPQVFAFQSVRNTLVFLFIGCLCLLGATQLPVQRWAVGVAERFPALSAWAEGFGHTAGYARSVGASPSVLLPSVLLVALSFGIMTHVYMEYFGIIGTPDVDTISVYTALLIITAISNLPIALNGIGVREQAHYLFFSALGVSKEIAVAISLLLFSQALLFGVLGLCCGRSEKVAGAATGSLCIRPAGSHPGIDPKRLWINKHPAFRQEALRQP